ncbi:carboxypeptidase regulatory-like domain-containing protein [Phycisphaeraceae bacterium D3-23]
MRIKWAGLWVLFLALAVGSAVFPAAAQDGTIEPTPDPVYLSGRVVDSEGEPIAGVELYAMPCGVPGRLASVLIPGSRYENALWGASTDDQGAFSIAVAFPGVIYRVGCRYDSTASFSTQEVIADPGVSVEIVAYPFDPQPVIEGQVVRSDGTFAAGATVELLGRYAGQRWTRRCDAMGRFCFDDIYARSWNGGTIYAKLDGEVSIPYTPVQMRASGGRVVLGLPGMAVGVLRDLKTGEPIVGATIIVEPRRYPQIRWTATTHDDGWFQVLDLPPGEYQYRAVCESHADRPPSLRRWDSRRVRVRAGETAELAGFQMSERALLGGRVLDADGQPVAGALVGCICHAGAYADGVDAVYTDAAGRYELHPGAFDEGNLREIHAYHPAMGSGSTRIEVFLPDPQRNKLEPGMAMTHFDIVLGGATRLRGRVTGPDGEPLAGIRCGYSGWNVHAATDDDGRYDLGMVSLATDPGGTRLRPVQAMPRGVITEGSYARWPDRVRQPEERHYIAGNAQGEPGPGGESTVDIQLEATDVLTFGGRVNRPVAWGDRGPKVYLIHGRVEGEQVRDSVLNFLKLLRRQEEQIRMHGHVSQLPIDHDLCVFRSIRSDKDGLWSAHYTRHDLETWAQYADRLRQTGLTQEERMLAELGVDVVRVFEDDRETETQDLAEDDVEAEPAIRWVTVLVVLGEMEYELHEPFELRMDKVDYTDPAAVLP